MNLGAGGSFAGVFGNGFGCASISFAGGKECR